MPLLKLNKIDAYIVYRTYQFIFTDKLFRL